jgi:hypothetical protein
MISQGIPAPLIFTDLKIGVIMAAHSKSIIRVVTIIWLCVSIIIYISSFYIVTINSKACAFYGLLSHNGGWLFVGLILSASTLCCLWLIPKNRINLPMQIATSIYCGLTCTFIYIWFMSGQLEWLCVNHNIALIIGVTH